MYRESFFSTRAVWCYSGARGGEGGDDVDEDRVGVVGDLARSKPLDRRRVTKDTPSRRSLPSRAATNATNEPLPFSRLGDARGVEYFF